MHAQKQVHLFETGMYRPPSEGGSNSLLLRFTRNCPWNKCAFCAMYKTEKFEIRPVEEIKADIDAMASIRDELYGLSASPGSIDRRAAVKFLENHPEFNYHQGFVMLFHWLIAGGKTAFLQDANSLIMKTPDLVEALEYLRKKFSSIQRVTTYARSRTLARKKTDELAAIQRAGLDRLHIGLESGDDELLKKVRKGVDAQNHITGGRKAVEAGFQVSEYWMPGLGGEDRWESHATETARVLSEINPHYIRSRPFRPLPGTPMYEAYQDGTFRLLEPEQQLKELKLTMEKLEVTSRVCFDHAGNYWRSPEGGLMLSHDYEGYKFPDQKQEVLSRIEAGFKARHPVPGFLQM
ncbi:MAG: B12-binding domain-containing radical SAM protein [Desulfobacteraceae bacterium]|nr:B12-binding domain-containing radical SAM protein [Desulfobacteraceae bacterium]